MKSGRKTWRPTPCLPGRRVNFPFRYCSIRGSSRCICDADRPIAPGATLLSVQLPQPRSSGPESAMVAVLPADNVELIPDAKAMSGLVRQQAGAAVDLPPRQQEPLFYRNEASNETTNAVFVAGLRRHAQQIGVDVASRFDVDEQGVAVEENLSYAIAYEPADHLLIEVPVSLTAAGPTGVVRRRPARRGRDLAG